MSKKITFNDILLEPILNLKNVNRYSGKFLLRPDNVAVHTVDMQGIVLLVCNYINSNLPKGCRKVDTKDAIYRTLVHDLDEAILCDLPRNFKYATPEFKKSVDETTMIFLKKAYSEELIKDILNAKSLRCSEGVIVKFADILHATIVLREEVIVLNNKSLQQTYNGNVSFLKDFLGHLKSLKINEHHKEILIELTKEIIMSVTTELIN